MANVLEQEWHHYFEQLNEVEKKSVLQLLKRFLEHRRKGSKRITIEQYNRELEESESQIEAGNFITQEDLEKEIRKW